MSAARSAAECLSVLNARFPARAVPRSPAGSSLVADFARGSWVHGSQAAPRPGAPPPPPGAPPRTAWLDFQCGIGVANTGHAHPAVAAAVAAQAARGLHLQQNCVVSRPTVALLEALEPVLPPGMREGGGGARIFFNVSGTEACESAVKLARHATGRTTVVAFRGGFHGRSLAALAMTSSKTAYGVGYGPLPAGFQLAPFPYCLHCGLGGAGGCGAAGGPPCCGAAERALSDMLHEVCAPRDTAAVLIEPILGEGGYVLPPAGFMRALRALCDEHGMLLMVDEVQSGVGRTGAFWAVEHEGVTPDVLVFAKGIASGMPLSGIAARAGLMDKSPPGSMGGTYGANAVCAAAAVATIGAIRDEGMLANAAARGEQLQAGLRAIAARHPDISLDVRGRGCMVGWELNFPPGSGFAGHLTGAAFDEGLLLLTAGWRETIRLIPPINVSQEDMATGIDMLARATQRALDTWAGPPHEFHWG